MASLYNKIRNYGKRRRRCTVPALMGGPQRKATVRKVTYTTPRKPNSAKRRYAKIMVVKNNRIIVHAKVPGIGKPDIQEYSVVMFEGGSPKDTPGVNYTLIRGKLDFDKEEEYGRMKSRSKFGLKTKKNVNKKK